MSRIPQRLAQILCLAAIAGFIGALSVMPAYTHRSPDLADIKLSFTHGAPRVDCHRRTAAELSRLPPQMRRPDECPRGRLPVRVRFVQDGDLLLDATLPPSGLSGDGPSRIYRNFSVHAGRHRLAFFLRDSPRASGFDYTFDQDVDIQPGQNVVVDFRPTTGGFYLR